MYDSLQSLLKKIITKSEVAVAGNAKIRCWTTNAKSYLVILATSTCVDSTPWRKPSQSKCLICITSPLTSPVLILAIRILN